MNSYTPGPWEAVPFNFSCVNMWDIRVKNQPDDDPYPIADMVFQEANARLIAAAPEMVIKLEQASCLLYDASTVDWLGAEVSKGIADRIDALLRRIKGKEEPK